MKDAESAVPPSAIISGFIKADIVHASLPAEAVPLVETTDDHPLSRAALFHSYIEGSDFESLDSDVDDRYA